MNDAEDLLNIEKLMGQEVPAYEPKVALETGEEPPALEALRAKAPAKGRRKKKKEPAGEKGRGARDKKPAKKPAEKPNQKTDAEKKPRRRRSRTDKARADVKPQRAVAPAESRKPAKRRRVGDQMGRQRGIH